MEYIVKTRIFNKKYVLGGGINKRIFVSNHQYLVKLWVFFNIPRMKELRNSFTTRRPRDVLLDLLQVLKEKKTYFFVDLWDVCGDERYKYC